MTSAYSSRPRFRRFMIEVLSNRRYLWQILGLRLGEHDSKIVFNSYDLILVFILCNPNSISTEPWFYVAG